MRKETLTLRSNRIINSKHEKLFFILSIKLASLQLYMYNNEISKKMSWKSVYVAFGKY